MNMSLLESGFFQTVFIDTTGTALSTDSSSLTIVDTAGYDLVCYVCLLDNVTAAGDVGLHLYHGDSSGTFYCTSTAVTPFITTTTTITDGSIIVLDVQKPVKRWHSIYVDRATQACRANIVAIKYNPKKQPVTQGTTAYYALATALAVSPTS